MVSAGLPPSLPPPSVDPGERPPSGRPSHRPPALSTGTQIDRYVIVQELGAGGMGAVYVAFDPQLARRVAIKVVRPEVNTPETRARLLGEAQAMARLAHPNVVAVYDVGPFGQDVFLAMEYIDGSTLKTWLKEPRPWREALATLVAAGRGLAAAHAAGIVHRDFKPDNVLLGRQGRVVVSDFGIARAEGAEAPIEVAGGGGSMPLVAPPAASAGALPLEPGPPASPLPAAAAASSASTPTATGALLGSVGYMSPERAFEGRDDARSDQFSFCVTLYLALYGRHPFEHHDLGSFLEAICHPPLPPPPGTRVPSWVGAAVLRGLRLDSSERFPSMHDLLDALGRDRGPRRRRIGAALVAAACASIAAAAYAEGGRARARACRAEGDTVLEAWSPSVEAAVGAAFARSEVKGRERLWDGTRAGLDDYARRWSEAAVDACRATTIERTQAEPVYRRRRACLRTRLAEMAELTHALADADPKLVRGAQEAVSSLSPLAGCSDPDELMSALDVPTDPSLEGRVAEMRRSVAEAKALKTIDHDVEALARVTPVVEEARRIGFAPLLAEALVEQGRAEPRGAEAESELVEAYRAALASRRFVTAGRAAAELTSVVGQVDGRHRDGHAWARLGEAALGASGSQDADDARTTILMTETNVYNQEEDAPGALDAAKRAALIAARHHPPADAIFERLHVATGVALVTAGDVDGSRREFEAAIAAAEEHYGPEHPRVADDLTSLATIEIADAHYDVARRELDRAIAIDATIRGAKHVNTAIYLLDRAQANHMLGACDAAIADAERAGGLYTEEQGADFGDLIITETIAADCHRVLGHPREAVAAIEHAERIAAKTSEGEPDALAEMRFVHAQILGAPDLRRAVALANEARAYYLAHAKTRNDRAWLAAIDAWLAGRSAR